MRRTPRRSYLDDEEDDSNNASISPLVSPSVQRRRSSMQRRGSYLINQISEEEYSKWVVVFGFPIVNVDDSIKQVLQHFQTFGSISNYRVQQQSNYIFLQYSNEREAHRALLQNSKKFLDSQILVGVIGMDSEKAIQFKFDPQLPSSAVAAAGSMMNPLSHIEEDLDARINRAYTLDASNASSKQQLTQEDTDRDVHLMPRRRTNIGARVFEVLFG